MPLRKILAIKLRALGDTVLMTAPLAQLKRAYPYAQIHAVVLSPWAPILENHPDVNRIWSYTKHRDTASRANALARLVFKIRQEKFDAVVNFHASPSSALMAFGSGAKLRSIHFHGHHDRNLYSTVQIAGKGTLKPIIERDMDTVRALGVEIAERILPKLYFTESETLEAGRILRGMNLKGSVLGIGLGASRPTKSWPLKKFAEAAINWCQKTQGSVLAFVGPGEESQALDFLHEVDQILLHTVSDADEINSVRSRIKFQQRLGVRQLAATIARCSVFLGNDSGPKHIAVAVGTPTVTVFGPEHPFEWHPYPRENHPYFFIENLACRKDADPGMPPWCGLHTCVIEKHRCMTGIEAEAVTLECVRVAKSRS